MARLVVIDTPVEKFTAIPNDVILRPDITPRAFRVLVWLIANVDGEISANRISQAIDMAEGTAKKALVDLEQLGYLHRAQAHDANGTFLRAEYRLSFDSTDNPTQQEDNR